MIMSVNIAMYVKMEYVQYQVLAEVIIVQMMEVVNLVTIVKEQVQSIYVPVNWQDV